MQRCGAAHGRHWRESCEKRVCTKRSITGTPSVPAACAAPVSGVTSTASESMMPNQCGMSPGGAIVARIRAAAGKCSSSALARPPSSGAATSTSAGRPDASSAAAHSSASAAVTPAFQRQLRGYLKTQRGARAGGGSRDGKPLPQRGGVVGRRRRGAERQRETIQCFDLMLGPRRPRRRTVDAVGELRILPQRFERLLEAVPEAGPPRGTRGSRELVSDDLLGRDERVRVRLRAHLGRQRRAVVAGEDVHRVHAGREHRRVRRRAYRAEARARMRAAQPFKRGDAGERIAHAVEPDEQETGRVRHARRAARRGARRCISRRRARHAPTSAATRSRASSAARR